MHKKYAANLEKQDTERKQNHTTTQSQAPSFLEEKSYTWHIKQTSMRKGMKASTAPKAQSVVQRHIANESATG